MDIKSLKDKILQLAIQGKLVSQDENDEPASVLLEKIKAEKEQLIKDKVIKKERTLSDISEDEKSFDLPKGWEWCRLGKATICRDGDRVPVSSKEREDRAKIYDYYGASGVIDKIDDYLFDKPLLLIGEDGANLISRSTPIAFIAYDKYWVNNHAHVIDSLEFITLKYLEIYINAIDLKSFVTGTAQPKLNQANLNQIPIMLPPLEEQERIVAKVDELFELIDELDSNKQELLENIFNIKNKVLQLAIQGKLVEQCEDDEPASVLLERIKAEKEQLIKDKIIKKEKPLPEISDEEKVFDLPNGWQWCRLGEVGYFQKGFAFKSKDYTDKGIKITKVSNLNNPNSKDIVYIDSANETLYEQYKLYNDDIVLTTVGSWPTAPASVVGNAIYIDDNFNNTLLNQNAVRIRTNLNQKYINIVFNSKLFKNYITDIAQGTANQASITQNGIKSFTLPVPPLEEQKRIADKVDVIMDYLDKLQQEIELQQIILENILK